MADPVTLWKANLKVNSDEGGFNFGFHIINNDVDAAKIVANDIAGRYKALLPKSAEIFYASISKWDSPRDGRYLHLAVGQGVFVEDAGPPELSDYDFAKTCINIRLETNDGAISTHKFNPVPDSIIYGGGVTDAILPVIGVPGTVPAVGAGANWHSEFTNFMAALVKNTAHIASPIPAGLAYTSKVYINAFATRVSVKKGGRVFI